MAQQDLQHQPYAPGDAQGAPPAAGAPSAPASAPNAAAQSGAIPPGAAGQSGVYPPPPAAGANGAVPPYPGGQIGAYPPNAAAQNGAYLPYPGGQSGAYPPPGMGWPGGTVPPNAAGKSGMYLPPPAAGANGAVPPPPGGQYGAYPPNAGWQGGATPPPYAPGHGAAYGAPRCAYAPPPVAARPARRKNRAPMVAALLCVGLLALSLLTGAAVQVLQRGGAMRERPQPGEVPSFAIEAPPDETDDGLSTVEIARAVSPSVVCINVYEPNTIGPVGGGSGIILNEEGFIITNAHVVEDASSVTVQLEDGREERAWVVGADARTDLAVIKITAEDLVPAVFGDSDALQVGERAVAIGNVAGEFSGTVTQGIISGLNREVTLESGGGYVTMHLIQTSAAINPGNSGGALVNRFGQVIGINSAKLNGVLYEGVGFAIPTADAQPIVADLIDYGYVKDRAALGVMVIALSPAMGEANDLPEQGLYISEIEEYSDLNRHDITVGDVILKADGVTLTDTADLLDVLEAHKPGETVRLEIQRHGSGTIVTIDVELVESRSE